MEKEKKQLGVAFIVVLVAIVMVSAIGIIAMSNKPVVLQGQIEATEIRISGKLPGRIDTFLVREGQYVKMGDTLVVINSPEAWAKFQQVNALEDIAKFQNKKIDDGTRRQIVRSVEELWNKSKSDLQLATVTYDRIQALYKDSVVTSQRKDEVEAMYKAAVAAERAAHQQFLLVKDGAQKEDKESARSLVDAARGTVNEVQALLMDARLTAPEDGQISGKLPGRIDTFLVREGQYVKMGDTLVVINSPEAWAKFQQVNALEDIAKFQNKKIDDGTRRQIVRSVEELWNKSKSDLQLATVTYDRIQALYKDSVVTSQRKDEVEAMYKAAVAAERAAHQQFLLVKDGAQKEDKESARSLVDAARGTVNEVQALLMDARLTAPEDGQISTIYPKRGELVGAGTPIMSLVVLDDCHVVLNVREDYMPYFRMNENFMGDIPALDVKNKAFKINYISPLGSFATWRSTKQTGTYDMKTFEIHALPVEPMEGLRPGMSVLVNLDELK